ncbi:MAG: hypothetical protein HND53_05370 [Proteobacteria bacterium]|nr:hypothetical protein [Pseudomonadota bacterium]NOG59911.1 hypothetical protein [Pseudomonadota bacterium]
MRLFRSFSDLNFLSKSNPAYPVILSLMPNIINTGNPINNDYFPSKDGYLVLIEKTDCFEPLLEIGIQYKLNEIPFEGITKIDGFFHAVYVPNNQFTLSFLVPDEPWIPENLRKYLEDHIDE